LPVILGNKTVPSQRIRDKPRLFDRPRLLMFCRISTDNPNNVLTATWSGPAQLDVWLAQESGYWFAFLSHGIKLKNHSYATSTSFDSNAREGSLQAMKMQSGRQPLKMPSSYRHSL
jgi:hypothetical protein